MSEPFLAEIRVFGFNFAPKGWALCDGQILSISQNTALFSLLGTTYGGNGTTTFALPNFQGMAGMSFGQGPGLSNRSLGETAGETTVTLTSAQMPQHTHTAKCQTNNGDAASPANAIWAIAGVDIDSINMYGSAGGGSMNPTALAPAGRSQPHNNMPPYQVLNFCIAMVGIFPPRS